MKKIAISQSNYIPWKGFFDNINYVDEFIFYDEVQYTKRDWRNRNKIKTPQGAQWITIPIEVKGKYYQKISETKVSDPRWGESHWKTIKHSYGQAPFFKEYEKIFEKLYLETNTEFLSQINFKFTQVICDLLGIKTKLLWSEDFPKKTTSENPTERLVEICQQTKATQYFTGASAQSYLDEALFNQNQIVVKYYDYSNYHPYHQLFGEFIHEVSVLDLIFNEGPHSQKYLKSFRL